MTDESSFARCHEFKQPLAVIDYRGEHLTGCMTCNLWDPGRRCGAGVTVLRFQTVPEPPLPDAPCMPHKGSSLAN
jgi:hypothetical protein